MVRREVNFAVALLLPAAVATLSSAMSPSDVIIRDVNPLPAALLVVKTVFAPKRWHFYLTSTAQSGSAP
jgi:hypothetical protein